LVKQINRASVDLTQCLGVLVGIFCVTSLSRVLCHMQARRIFKNKHFW